MCEDGTTLFPIEDNGQLDDIIKRMRKAELEVLDIDSLAKTQNYGLDREFRGFAVYIQKHDSRAEQVVGGKVGFDILETYEKIVAIASTIILAPEALANLKKAQADISVGVQMEKEDSTELLLLRRFDGIDQVIQKWEVLEGNVQPNDLRPPNPIPQNAERIPVISNPKPSCLNQFCQFFASLWACLTACFRSRRTA